MMIISKHYQLEDRCSCDDSGCANVHCTRNHLLAVRAQ